MMTAESLALLIAATLNAGTVVALASLGLLINERAGVLNLGAEGMMLVAAIAGYAACVHTGSDVIGFAAAAGAGALLAAAFGVLVIWLGTNQYATGLALSLFGAGLSAFVGITYTQLFAAHHWDVYGEAAQRAAWAVLARKIRARHNRLHPDLAVQRVRIGALRWPISTLGYWAGKLPSRTRSQIWFEEPAQ